MTNCKWIRGCISVIKVTLEHRHLFSFFFSRFLRPYCWKVISLWPFLSLFLFVFFHLYKSLKTFFFQNPRVSFYSDGSRNHFEIPETGETLFTSGRKKNSLYTLRLRSSKAPTLSLSLSLIRRQIWDEIKGKLRRVRFSVILQMIIEIFHVICRSSSWLPLALFRILLRTCLF